MTPNPDPAPNQESIPMAPAGIVWMKLVRHALSNPNPGPNSDPDPDPDPDPDQVRHAMCGFGATCMPPRARTLDLAADPREDLE